MEYTIVEQMQIAEMTILIMDMVNSGATQEELVKANEHLSNMIENKQFDLTDEIQNFINKYQGE